MGTDDVKRLRILTYVLNITERIILLSMSSRAKRFSILLFCPPSLPAKRAAFILIHRDNRRKPYAR